MRADVSTCPKTADILSKYFPHSAIAYFFIRNRKALQPLMCRHGPLGGRARLGARWHDHHCRNRAPNPARRPSRSRVARTIGRMTLESLRRRAIPRSLWHRAIPGSNRHRAIPGSLRDRAIPGSLRRRAIPGSLRRRAILESLRRRAILESLGHRAMLENLRRRAMLEKLRRRPTTSPARVSAWHQLHSVSCSS
jgi:hypothetical protein